MTKSPKTFDFLGLYAAVLKDIAAYHPADQMEWDRDFVSLTRLVKVRGNAIFTMDLPALRKALDRGLADGCLSVNTLALSTQKYKRSPLPKLFWGLWSKLFDLSGCLRVDIDPNDVLFLRCLLDAGKNYVVKCAPKYLYKAVEEFFDVESSVESPSSFWLDDSIPTPCHPMGGFGRYMGELGNITGLSSDDARSLAGCLELSARQVSGLIGLFEPDEWSFRHGPGAVSNHNSKQYKYDFKEWSESLQRIFPFDRYGITGLGLMDRLQPDGIEIDFVDPFAKMIDVPKSAKTPRLIAAEPSFNQWAQQCIRDFMYTRVDRTWLGKSVHFRDQSYNQRRAVEGSRYATYSTIDLKSASDRLSCGLVECVFWGNNSILDAFRSVRTRTLVQDICTMQPASHALNKFSTMGSALTFPVQSIVFLTVALGVGAYVTGKKCVSGLASEVLVFGDDIIVPNGWTELLSSTLEALGLLVNRAKTFSSGNFRESCGMDAWNGYDVTPPHVTRDLESSPDAVLSNVAVSNNFFKKGFWHAASWIREAIGIQRIPVTKFGSGVFGFESYSGHDFSLKKRWNRDLQRTETLCYTITSRNKVLKQNSAAALLQFFTEEPPSYIKYDSGKVIAGRPVSRSAWIPLSEVSLSY